MNLILLFVFSLSCSAAAVRYVFSENPKIMVSSNDIKDGESVDVICIIPIDYRGGDCRLYRGRAKTPFKKMIALDYVCVFHLTSSELLGKKPVGSEILVWFDYQLQQYTSIPSDKMSVTVWGVRPSPSLSISHHFVTPDDIIEITCSPPISPVYECKFYKNDFPLAEGSCSKNITGRDLFIWEKPTLLFPVNLTCTYDTEKRLYIRSKDSNQQLLFVVDVSRTNSSVDCKVSVRDELTDFRGNEWRTVGPDGTTVTVQVTNGTSLLDQSCNLSESN